MSVRYATETFLENVVLEIRDIPSTEELKRTVTGPALVVKESPKETVSPQEVEDLSDLPERWE